MKKLLFVLFAIGLMAGFSNKVVAQAAFDNEVFTYQLDAFAILDIEGTPPSLELVKPTNAGLAVPDVSTDANATWSWINYTSIIDVDETYDVTVEIDVMPPSFTTLKVAAAEHFGTGDGSFGTRVGDVTFAAIETAEDIITGIGSCWSGDGANGHKLTYTWGITAGAYANAVSVASASDITVLYTIIAIPAL